MRTNTQTPREGFTLVEILVAVLILAILMGAVGVLLSSVLRLREASNRSLEQNIPQTRAIAIIENDLKQALPPQVNLVGPFTGTCVEEGKVRHDSLIFSTASGILTDKAPWGDVMTVEYALQTPGNAKQHGRINKNAARGLDLTRTVTRNLLATTSETLPTETLLHEVDSFQVDYYDAANAQWIEKWSTDDLSTRSLPTAIRVQIGFLASAQKNEAPKQPIEIVTEVVNKPPTTE
jgi:type II secretion system protein J